MDSANPFAQTPLTPDPIIAQVCRQLRAEPGADWSTTDTLVDGVVDRVVRELWESRVRTFVPILALRESRTLLHVERGAMPPLAAAGDDGASNLAASAATVPPVGDHVARGHDTLAHVSRDALRVDSDRLTI